MRCDDDSTPRFSDIGRPPNTPPEHITLRSRWLTFDKPMSARRCARRFKRTKRLVMPISAADVVMRRRVRRLPAEKPYAADLPITILDKAISGVYGWTLPRNTSCLPRDYHTLRYTAGRPFTASRRVFRVKCNYISWPSE